MQVIEVLRQGKWTREGSFAKIKRGEHFRLFEPDGTPVEDRAIYESHGDGYASKTKLEYKEG
jgi:hypothetical protein